MEHLMEIREAAFPFPGGEAVLSLSLDPGVTHVILGGPESGTEEIGRILTGGLEPLRGEILTDGVPVSFSSAGKAGKHGFAPAPGLFGSLCAEDHLRLLPPGGRPLRSDRAALTEAFLPGTDLHAPADALSPIERLGLRLLLSAVRGDRLTVLEDPLRDIPPALFDRAAEKTERLAQEGCCVVILTGQPRHARLAQRVTAVKDGRVVYDGASRDRSLAFLERALDFGPHLRKDRLREIVPGGVVMEIRDLSSRRVRGKKSVRSVSFEIREGETVGLCAMKGEGGERLLHILAGLEKPAGGRIRLKGNILKKYSYPDIHRHVRYVPSPIGTAPSLLPDITVRESLAMQCSRFSSVFVNGVLSPSRLDGYTRFLLKEYPIGASGDAPLSSLTPSGLRMLTEAPELDRSGCVLLLSHPAETLTPDAFRFLVSCLEEEKLRHTGVLYLTDRVDEALTVCDRILVLHDGRIVLSCDCMGASGKEIALAVSGPDGGQA